MADGCTEDHHAKLAAVVFCGVAKVAMQLRVIVRVQMDAVVLELHVLQVEGGYPL